MLRHWQRVVAQILPAVVLGAIAFALVLAATEPPGPGLDPDAVSYLGAAESLAHGQGYRIPTAEWVSPDTTQPLAHFPPGYSTILAIPIVLGAQPIQGARVVEAVAAFVTTVALVLLVTSATDTITAVLLVIALFAMTSMHEVHISILSEPVYLACMVIALAAMVWWPARPLRAGIPAAVAAITRYAGVSLVGAVALWMLTRAGSWRERITRACIAVAPAAVLQLLWVVRTRESRDAEDIRRFAIYGDVGRTLRQGLATLTAWLVPDPTVQHDVANRGVIACAVAAVVIALAFMGYNLGKADVHALRRRPQGDSQIVVLSGTKDTHLTLLHASALLLASYLALVITSRLFADPLIPLDERIMSPALLLMMIILAVTISAWWRHSRLLVARIGVAAMLAIWWLASAGATRLEARYALTWGSDFAGQEWRTSELIAWARKNATRTQLYTNWPAAVYFYLHRNSHELPKRADQTTLDAFGDTLRARRGVLLLFGPSNYEYIPNDSVFNVPGLKQIDLRDGIIFIP